MNWIYLAIVLLVIAAIIQVWDMRARRAKQTISSDQPRIPWDL